MKQTDAEYRAILRKADLPTTGLPKGAIEDARWQMGSNDWYVQIASRWYWFDERHTQRCWKYVPLGPM